MKKTRLIIICVVAIPAVLLAYLAFVGSARKGHVTVDVRAVESPYLRGEPILVSTTWSNDSSRVVRMELGWRWAEKFRIKRLGGAFQSVTASELALGLSASSPGFTIELKPRGVIHSYLPVEKWVTILNGTNQLTVDLDTTRKSKFDRNDNKTTIRVQSRSEAEVVLSEGGIEMLKERIRQWLERACEDEAAGAGRGLIRDALLELARTNSATFKALKNLDPKSEDAARLQEYLLKLLPSEFSTAE